MRFYRNETMYLQKRDIPLIMEAAEKKYHNSQLTSSIFMLTACQNGSDFKAITDRGVQEFIDEMDFVVDFDELEALSEEDVEIKRIEATRILDEVQRRLNKISKPSARNELTVELHLATHRLSSIKDYIEFKRGTTQIDFPMEVNIIDEKGRKKSFSMEHNGN